MQDFEPPVDRQIFVLPFVPVEADFDENNHVNNGLPAGHPAPSGLILTSSFELFAVAASA
ncbi:MAG: hypothetical protein ACOC91_01130 [bacterium]